MADHLPNRAIAARLLAAASLAMLVAGCSNDPTRIDYGQITQGVAAQLGVTSPFGRSAPAASQGIAAPAVILAQTNAPVTLAQPANGAAPFYMVGVRENGPWRTYATGTRQTLVLRQGLVTATRGLGQDLMASQVDETLSLLRSGKPGKARRVMQVLDGEDITRDLVLDCTLAVEGQVRTPAGLKGRTMTEDCAAGDFRFRNTYVVDASGMIIQSRQWLPTRLGPLSLQVLRP
jgi:hypothetical protein